jgi:hypothetical protein
MKRRIILCVAYMLLYGNARAQLSQHEPQNISGFNNGSSETYSTTKDVIYKVNEATGANGLSVPLFTISQGGFTLPVSLNYNATGIRVDENASRVGLGWSLNAGGLVTRVVKGISDQTPSIGYNTYTDGNNPLPGPNSNLPAVQTILNNIFTGTMDGEPDLTVFSFGDRGGKFIINPNDGNAYTIPYQRLKVESGALGGYTECYKITDENGIQYFFADIEKVTIKDAFGATLAPQTNTSYYLSKIILTDQTQITFQYSSVTVTTFTGNRDTKVDRLMKVYAGNPCDAPATAGQGATNLFRTSIFLTAITPRISWITTTTGRIGFTYDGTRTDVVGDSRLSQVTQYDLQGNEVKKYVLGHDYSPDYIVGDGRLRLRTVTQRDQSGNNLLPVSFTYNNTPFPPVGTPKQDEWGYYNNGANTESYTLSTGGSGVYSLLPFVDGWHQGSDRSIQPVFAQAGILTGITYPDGATAGFIYESNMYRDPYTNTDQLGPGLRIKSIASGDGIGGIKYTSYTYMTTGANPFTSGKLNDIKSSPNLDFIKDITIAHCPCVLRRSDPLNKTPVFAGSAIYYTRVEVTEHSDAVNIAASKLGSTVFEFDFHTDYNSQVRLFLIKEHLNSVLKKTITLDKFNNVVQSISYNYQSPTDKLYLTGTIPFITGIDLSGNNSYSYNTYRLYSSWMPVSSTLTRTYEVGSTTRYVDEITNYTYNPITLLPESKTTTINGTVYKQRYKRPADYNTTTATDEQVQAIQALNGMHILTPVIEMISLKNGMVVSGQLVHYKIVAGVGPVVKSSYALKNMAPYSEASHTFSNIGSGTFTWSANYKKQSENLVFDGIGTPLETEVRNTRTAIIFNPNIQQTTAVSPFSSHNDIAYSSFEDYEIVTSPASVHSSSNWLLQSTCGTTIKSTDAFAGSNSLQVGGSCNIQVKTLKTLNTAKSYRITFWAKNAVPAISVTGTPPAAPTVLEESNGWKLYQYILSGVSSATIGMTGSGLMDELKLTPIESGIQAIVYRPLIGAVSTSDTGNHYQHSVYDSFGRIIKLLDHDKNIIKSYEHIQQEQQ